MCNSVFDREQNDPDIIDRINEARDALEELLAECDNLNWHKRNHIAVMINFIMANEEELCHYAQII